MQQVLAVAIGSDWPTGLDLRPFAVSQVPDLDPNSVLTSIEAVIIVPGSTEKVAATVRIIDEARRGGGLALLLAGHPKHSPMDALINAHPFDAVLDLDWPESLMCAAIENAVRNVQIARDELEIQRAVLELAVDDELSRIFSHRHFAALMAREHDRSRRRGLSYALVYLEHGVACGSQALVELAQIVTESLRRSDAALRIGADGLVLFLAGCNKAAAAALANRLCERLASLSIHVSAGIAAFPEDAVESPELLARADLALLWAKASGRSRAVIWSPELAATANEPRRAR